MSVEILPTKQVTQKHQAQPEQLDVAGLADGDHLRYQGGTRLFDGRLRNVSKEEVSERLTRMLIFTKLSWQVAMLTRHPRTDLKIRSSQEFCLRTDPIQMINQLTIYPTWSCFRHQRTAGGWGLSRVLQIVSAASLTLLARDLQFQCARRQPRQSPGGWSSSPNNLYSDPRPDSSDTGLPHLTHDSPPPTFPFPSWFMGFFLSSPGLNPLVPIPNLGDWGWH